MDRFPLDGGWTPYVLEDVLRCALGANTAVEGS